MNSKFYKMRRNRMISGVLAGLSDKWNFDVTLVRFLFAILTVANFGLGVIINIILASSCQPTKKSKQKCTEQAHVNEKKLKPLTIMKAGFGEVLQKI